MKGPVDIQRIIMRKLTTLNAAPSLNDIAIPHGDNLASCQ